MDPRLRHLLDRALDGELTPLEHAELTRLRARCPEARREAAAWDRMRAGLTATLDQAPPLDLDRLARKIERDVRQQRSRRPLVAAASLVVLGALAATGATDGVRMAEVADTAASAHASTTSRSRGRPRTRLRSGCGSLLRMRWNSRSRVGAANGCCSAIAS